MISYKKQRAFSLVEALMGVLVIGLVFAMMLPFVIKKADFDKTKKDSQGFYFEHSENNTDNRCFATSSLLNSGDNTTLYLTPTGDCQKYEFVVPDNVHYIDLTLVAGGGGGGGAAGGTIYKNHMTPSTSAYLVNFDLLKNIYIKYMIQKGETGGSATTTNTGRGGKMGNAIVNYNMTRDTIFNILFNSYPEFFIKGDPSDLNADHNPIIDDDGNKYTQENYKRFYVKLARNTIATDLSAPYNEKYSNIFFTFFRYGRNNNTTCQNATAQAFYGITNCHSFRLSIKGTETTTNKVYEFSKKNKTRDEVDCVALDGSTNSNDIEKYNNYCQDYEYMKSFMVKSRLDQKTYYDNKYTDGAVKNASLIGQNGEMLKIAGEYGKGGNGGSITAIESDKNGGVGGGAWGEIDIVNEYPGQSGAGGVGGAAITLNKFPVTPGARYTIYVGSGGKGGLSGTEGEIINSTSTETSGSRGTGGVSTALYDENNNLVVMVLGGVGGDAGNTKSISSALTGYYNDNNTTINNAYPEIPSTTRHYPAVIIGSNYIQSNNPINIGTIAQDKYTNKIAVANENGNNINLGTVYRIKYNNLSEAVQLLNSNSDKIFTSGSRFGSATTDDDEKTGGFSYFTKYNDANSSFVNKVYMEKILYNTLTYDRAYNGFYFRYLDGYDYMYAGGLGGFSGLGTKAGCGGGFVGNKTGRMQASTQKELDGDTPKNVLAAEKTPLRNTFIIGRNLTTTNNYLTDVNTYQVNDYYDNCSLDTPNGHSAKFVKPQISSVKGIDYGQAGSGGGGGGWSTKYGAGNGGNGQNGYVFIVWDK